MLDFFGIFSKAKQNKVPVGSIWCMACDKDNPFMVDLPKNAFRPLFKVLAVNGGWVQYQRGLDDSSCVDTMRLTSWLYIFAPVPKSWNVQ